METTSCLLCGSDDCSPLITRPEPRHVVCRRCGLVYQNPRPTVKEMESHYQAGYWEARQADQEPVSCPRGEAVVSWCRQSLTPGSLVIEIGCGSGAILAHVRDAIGCRVVGVEPSTLESEQARKRFGLEIVHGGLGDAVRQISGVDLLILSHVLEHFHDPREALIDCRQLLARDGLIWIEVPNILCPPPRKRFSIWLAREHMTYLSAGTLGWLLQAAGFTILRVEDSEALRIMARLGEVQSSRPPFPSECRQVRRAAWLHGIRYWPWYAWRRLTR